MWSLPQRSGTVCISALSSLSSTTALLLLILLLRLCSTSAHAIDKGCRKVGAEELIDEKDCDLLIVRVNRCAGYCFSLTYPNLHSGKTNGVSKCCRMTDTEWVNAELSCVDGPQQIRIPSAVQCDCFDCPII